MARKINSAEYIAVHIPNNVPSLFTSQAPTNRFSTGTGETGRRGVRYQCAQVELAMVGSESTVAMVLARSLAGAEGWTNPRRDPSLADSQSRALVRSSEKGGRWLVGSGGIERRGRGNGGEEGPEPSRRGLGSRFGWCRDGDGLGEEAGISHTWRVAGVQASGAARLPSGAHLSVSNEYLRES